MRVCPRCRATYSARTRFCEKDAAVLVEELDIERIGATVGNYHLHDILGRGGMGTVYRGEHVYIGRQVALKILHPRFARYEEAVSRFLREARAASSINHPNIVDVTDFGPLPDGGVFFVMEYLEGTSLEDMIEREGAIELHRSLNVANQMARALAAAHDTGIIHRDLKPDNIMLIQKPGRRELIKAVEPESEDQKPGYVIEKERQYDFVKLLDFGIAKVLSHDDVNMEETLQGAVFGTPEYMSPEAARGDAVDRRADIYSVGVILYDMVTGRPPFEARAAAEVLSMHINAAPPPPREAAPHREITEATENLIIKAMAKDPDHRHQSMDELRAELQNCYGSVAFRRNPVSIPGAPAASSRMRRLTEELDEWLQSDESRLSAEQAMNLALADQEEELDEFFDDDRPTDPRMRAPDEER